LEQVTTSNVQNLNSNFENKKFYLCRLPNGLAGGKGDATCQAATFATSFSLPPARIIGQSAKNPLPTAFRSGRLRKCLPTALLLSGGKRF